MVDGRPAHLSIFATIEPGGCDGLCVDRLGNLWSSAGDGVHCFAPDGVLLGKVALGEMTTNLCFLVGSSMPGIFVTTPNRALVCTFDALPEGFGNAAY